MSKIERDIDCRKYRKSTHLASADLDAMTSENKQLIFTIDDVWYEKGVDVSGNKTDGYFCKLKGAPKDMVLNSTNRNTLAVFARNNGFKGAEAYNIGNWKGLLIELSVDRNVKMMGKIVDGMRIKPIQPTKTEPKKKDFTEANFEKAKAANATIEQIKKAYSITPKMETKYLEYAGK